MKTLLLILSLTFAGTITAMACGTPSCFVQVESCSTPSC
jgi:hypothetical protein